MNSDVFYEYIANLLDYWLEENKIPKPVVLFVDGHKSHMTMHLSEICDNKGIILYALPPNATHIMQPADVSVFRPLKAKWKDTIRQWQNQKISIVFSQKSILHRYLKKKLNFLLYQKPFVMDSELVDCFH